MMQIYPSIEQANEVLEFYENYLLRCKYLIYIAVIEVNLGYKLEIGVQYKNRDKVIRDKDLDDLQIYFGLFEENVIPKSFPIPSEFEYRLKDILSRSKLNNFKISEINYSTDGEIKLFEKQEDYKTLFSKSSVINSVLNVDTEYKELENLSISEASATSIKAKRRSIQLITKEKKKATLGAIFELLNYPNLLFGITNQHLFDYKGARLGDSVYNEQGIKIGELFWQSDDIYRDSAIIKMSNNFCKENIQNQKLILKQPSISMFVDHNGLSTYPEEMIYSFKSKIISTNATLRHIDPNHTHGWKIYKKQLLIEENSEGGDSGSLVFTNEDGLYKTVGLNFGISLFRVVDESKNTKSYTIANNLNFIFNSIFEQKQEVFIAKTNDFIQTSLEDTFKLNNNII